MSFTETDVQNALKNLTDPNTKKDFVSGKSVKNIEISGNDITLDILLGYPAKSVWGEIKTLVESHLKAVLPGVSKVEVNVSSKVVPHAVQRGVKLVDGVKNIIAVASGKGGVGKSTTAVNLALALAAEGARVGVLDADVYGPSQPTMLGITGNPDSADGKSMQPMQNYGLQVMSIGFLIDADTPMIWRGPMATQALDQLLH
ncbi:MAG: iron-sulfur cluster carrier protein ApbC, partial [Gallionellales bacterium CG08_land_8_20_14_0_20_59_87]